MRAWMMAVCLGVLVAGGVGSAQEVMVGAGAAVAQPGQGGVAATAVATKAPTTTERPAVVVYKDGLISVKADDSSLNEILAQISHRLTMRITGRVADERVFGSYGPETPGNVLKSLLDGTGSNMLLTTAANGLPELLLTPREGGVTPPAAAAAVVQDNVDSAAFGRQLHEEANRMAGVTGVGADGQAGGTGPAPLSAQQRLELIQQLQAQQQAQKSSAQH